MGLLLLYYPMRCSRLCLCVRRVGLSKSTNHQRDCYQPLALVNLGRNFLFPPIIRLPTRCQPILSDLDPIRLPLLATP